MLPGEGVLDLVCLLSPFWHAMYRVPAGVPWAEFRQMLDLPTLEMRFGGWSLLLFSSENPPICTGACSSSFESFKSISVCMQVYEIEWLYALGLLSHCWLLQRFQALLGSTCIVALAAFAGFDVIFFCSCCDSCGIMKDEQPLWTEPWCTWFILHWDRCIFWKNKTKKPERLQNNPIV